MSEEEKEEEKRLKHEGVVGRLVNEDILPFIYTGKVVLRDANHALDIFKGAELFAISDLQKLCMTYLIQNLNPCTALSYFELANQKLCTEAQNYFLEYICFNAQRCLLCASDEHLNQLGYDSFINLLEQEFLSLKEDEVVEVVRRWLEYRKSDPTIDMPTLIESVSRYVRLPLFNANDLYDTYAEIKIDGHLLFSDKMIQETTNAIGTATPRTNSNDTFSSPITYNNFTLENPFVSLSIYDGILPQGCQAASLVFQDGTLKLDYLGEEIDHSDSVILKISLNCFDDNSYRFLFFPIKKVSKKYLFEIMSEYEISQLKNKKMSVGFSLHQAEMSEETPKVDIPEETPKAAILMIENEESEVNIFNIEGEGKSQPTKISDEEDEWYAAYDMAEEIKDEEIIDLYL